MLKSKGLMLLVVFAAAWLPVTPAQSSELVKLGKLIVTGKRGPAAPGIAVEPRSQAPRDAGTATAPAGDRWFPKATTTEPSAERPGAGVLPAFKLSVDAAEPAIEPVEPQRPSPETPRERVGKAVPVATS